MCHAVDSSNGNIQIGLSSHARRASRGRMNFDGVVLTTARLDLNNGRPRRAVNVNGSRPNEGRSNPSGGRTRPPGTQHRRRVPIGNPFAFLQQGWAPSANIVGGIQRRPRSNSNPSNSNPGAPRPPPQFPNPSPFNPFSMFVTATRRVQVPPQQQNQAARRVQVPSQQQNPPQPPRNHATPQQTSNMTPTQRRNQPNRPRDPQP